MPRRALPVMLMTGLLAMVLTGCTKEDRGPQGTLPPPDVAEPPPDAQVTASGLAYRVLSQGRGGRHPGATSRVVVNYTGWTTDGTVVEGAPVGTPPVVRDLSEAIGGWREGLRLMSPGDKYRFWIPAHLAYLNQAGKPQGMLVYDIYLVDFSR